MDIDIKYDSSTLKNYKLVQPGDFIISLRSFQGGFETSYLTGITSPAYTIFNFIDNQSQNHMFWQYLFKRKNFINSLKKVTFGIRDGKAISFSQFGDVKVEYPDFDEQKHIAITLNKIDDTIQLHERKCEELALIKKALLQKLFPKKDEIKPEVRYKNFSDAWEQRKLGETSKITAGGDVNKEKLLTHGKFPVIANALTNNGIVGYYNDYYRIAAPAVTVTGRGEIGKAKSRKINFTPVVRLLAVESKHNVDFLAEAINRSKVVFESTGVPQLTVPKLSNYKISFPNSVDEETKIGDFLQQFDTLIALHQRKLEKLKQLKKFLLQNMFI